MKMADYLAEVHHAVSVLIPYLWDERNSLSELEKQLVVLGKKAAVDESRAAQIEAAVEDTDDVSMATQARWDSYFGSAKDLHDAKESITRVTENVAAHATSISALSGALLQIAKQGISIVHAGFSTCPKGRPIKSQCLRDVILQARNQAIHWEEGKFRSPTEICFKTLQSDFGSPFDQFETKCLASDVVELLGWKDVKSFNADLMTLA